MQVLTLQSVNASVGASSGSASVTGVNVGSEEITFAAPGSTGNTAFRIVRLRKRKWEHACDGHYGQLHNHDHLHTKRKCKSDRYLHFEWEHGIGRFRSGKSDRCFRRVGRAWLAYGAEAVNKTSQFGATVTLTNTGILPLNIAAVGSTNGSLGGVTDLTGTCTLLPSLNQNQSCTVTFTFTAENDNATIFVTDNSGGTEVVQSVVVDFRERSIRDGGRLRPWSIPRNLLNRSTSK